MATAKTSSLRRVIALPPRGVRLRASSTTPELQSFFEESQPAKGSTKAHRMAISSAKPDGLSVNVVDVIDGTGARLLEGSDDAILALRAQQPGLRIVPIVTYYPAVVRLRAQKAARAIAGAKTATAAKVTFRVQGTDGSPVVGAMVVAFTDFATKVGAQGPTGAKGTAALAVAGKIQRVYVYPSKGYWTAELRNVSPKAGVVAVTVQAINMAYKDVLRSFYPAPSDSDGEGVVVGVIDTGSGPHPDLVIAGGMCTVKGESPGSFQDNGMQHGTHVAGIIGGRGKPGVGMRGVAPGVTLRAYRVFPTPVPGQPEPGADNFSIAKAIDQAITDGCDLINMSLGGGDPDPATESAIHDARGAGVAVIVASGNDGHKVISFPGSDALAVAVSALGQKGTLPAGTVEAVDDAVGPFGKNQTFMAPFANIGDGTRNIDLVGPGVGILSTVPGGYACMSGTSMACPAVTGAAAQLLGANAAVRNMVRNEARSDAILRLLFAVATSMGFTVEQEGHGLLP